MAPTIKEVAKIAQVSPSTVSRVISNSPRISPKTKMKVKKIMDDLGYHPNVNARNLAVNSTYSIGVVMPSSTDKALQNPFFPEVLRGIGSVARELDYSLYVSTGGNLEEQFEEVKRMVFGNRVDGVILLYSRVNDAITKFLLEKNFPFVIVGKPLHTFEDITYVDNDNIKASKELTQHLIDLGHKNIGFIGGPAEQMVTADRLKGFELSMKNSKNSVPDEYKIQTEFLEYGGRKAVERLISLEDPPTGLVVTDDIVSLGVMNTLNDLGFSVPKDVSIVSFNNVYLAEIATPPLTTVDINIFKLGAKATDSLINKINSKSVKPIIIPHKIKYRNSTKSLSLRRNDI